MQRWKEEHPDSSQIWLSTKNPQRGLRKRLTVLAQPFRVAEQVPNEHCGECGST